MTSNDTAQESGLKVELLETSLMTLQKQGIIELSIGKRGQ
jgi:DNA-binding IscR family transcriptional regulator